MKIIIQFFALLVFSCGTAPKQNVMFVLPVEYSGFIWVADQGKNQENKFKNKSLVKIVVDPKGLALVSSSCFNYLKNWTSYSTNLRLPDHHLFDIGSVNEFRVYYYGTRKDYDRDTKSNNLLEISPKL